MLLVTAPGLHLSSIAVCVMMTGLVYSVTWFDAARTGLFSGAALKADAVPGRQTGSDPSLDVMRMILAFAALLMAVGFGWWLPVRTEQAFGITPPAPVWDIAMPPLGRLAQVVGMICLGLITLRLLGWAIIVAGIAITFFGSGLAADYLLGRGWLTPPY